MDALKEIAITLAAWVALTFLSVNLLGFAMHGLAANPLIANESAEGQNHSDRAVAGGQIISVILFGMIALFLVALYHYWNIGVALAALLIMLARIPDLIWEMNAGRKLEMSDMRRPAFYRFSTMLSWLSLPLLWYAIYRG